MVPIDNPFNLYKPYCIACAYYYGKHDDDHAETTASSWSGIAITSHKLSIGKNIKLYG